MNVLVFGANGMLGRYVCSRLSQEYKVHGLIRKDLELSTVKKEQLEAALELTKANVVINCAGVIKPRVDLEGTNTILVNSVFPRILASVCKNKDISMIHVSTDCVFDGLQIYSYSEIDLPTTKDLYGRTKFLGETENCCVIRTSIVGEELNQFRSLIEWAKSQKGRTVSGFVDHWWNGVSCLQLSDLISLMIKNNIFWSGVRHVYSPDTVSKYRLLEIINDVYNLDIQIEPRESKTLCNRSLKTVFPDWADYLLKNIPFIEKQIVSLRDFKLL